MALSANRRHSHPSPVGWKHFEHPSPTGHFWSKSVRDANSSSPLQIHYGISKRQRDPNGPNCFFNCNLLPRTSDISKEDIAILCCSVASFARGHRGSSQGYCNCTFLDLKQGNKCVKSGRWAFRLLCWVDAMLVRRYVRQHDSLCSCRCFDVRVLGSDLPPYSRV
ncbi:uncharacterized protein M437DRAFT_51718 [Aureobasidium melanogenum CBS 110374]|uniref:Uncharacterized protein n=1 Tax=Aureobasidium melanogenum (strain CBS 110374) TaxID=1043003 RepID=A0A074VME4_AURM1|nr:uncharacterized protein M437DRAFT_51718 [Aureobasidium melanogenum CBS 110374]KEQ61653.1 hypothetical protein M437DRAFT_51718 [Aureobasidium melanogenum CBS 110374]